MAIHLQFLIEAMSEEGPGEVSEWLPESVPSAGLALPKPDAEGHYQSPALDHLRATLTEFAGGRLAFEAAASHLEALHADIAGRLECMRISLQQGLDQADDPLHQAILGGLLQFQMALKVGELFVNTGHAEMLNTALQLGQQATDELAVSFHRFAEHARACLFIHCPACSCENDRGAERCTGCGQALPRMIESAPAWGEAEPTLAVTTPNHDRLVAAVEGYRSGALAPEGLHQELTGVWQNLQRHLRTLARDRQEGARLGSPAYLEVLQAIETGLQASLEAVEEMLGRFDSGLEAHLEQGLELLFEATPCLVEAYEALQNLEVRQAA